MTGLSALVNQKVELESRRDTALTILAERSGVPVPAFRGGYPKPLTATPWVLDHLSTEVFALEQCVQLAAEFDALTVSAQNGKAKR